MQFQVPTAKSLTILAKKKFSIIVFFTLVLTIGVFALPKTTHAAQSLNVKTSSGWSVLYNGHHLPNAQHYQKTIQPNSLPGTEPCIKVALTANNFAFQQIRVTMGFINNCGANLTNVNWEVDTQIACGPNQFAGPSGTGSFGNINKGASITAFNQSGKVTCLHNGIPQNWTASSDATVDGDIVGSDEIGRGTAASDIGGY